MAKPKNRFEEIANLDVDGAVLRVGIQHYASGVPSDPSIEINAGAVAVTICLFPGDLTKIIDALKAARKQLRQSKRQSA